MKLYRIFLLGVQMAYVINVSAQTRQPIASLLDQYLAIQQQAIGFNGVVMISKDGNLVYKKAIGDASIQQKNPLTENSVFRIASVTKQFTALLTVIAAGENKLRLQDSLAVYFPELQGDWRKITIHQLLTHTSGIPHNEGISSYWQTTSLLPLTGQEALSEILKMKLLFKPGAKTQYSSPGYYLLAAILEKCYHKSYADILTERVTFPLQMANTGVYDTRKIIPWMASPYHLLGDSLIVAPYRDFSLMKGSGDLYSDAPDLLKWNQSFLSKNTWPAGVKELLFTEQNREPVNGHADNYGYGWFLRSGSGSKRAVYYTGGGTFGCSAISAIYPGDTISIVILSNISVLPVNQMLADVEKIVFGDEFVMPELHKTAKLTSAQLVKFPGTYVTETGQQLQISLAASHLYAKMGPNPAFEIYPSSAERFYGKKVAVTFTFKKDERGDIIGMEADVRGQKLQFIKKQP